MENKTTVTIGIPVYNEEANIKHLLKSLISQKTDSWKLERIIVVSDKSTDTTDKIIRSFGKQVLLIRNKKRLGTALSLNIISIKNRSDVLVLLNGDVLPNGRFFVSNLISSFQKNEKIGIIGGKTTPLKGQTLIENIVNYSVEMKTNMYQKTNKGNNIYMCHGRVRAFSQKFSKKFKWKQTFGEDAYSYLCCLLLGFKFKYEPKASIRYRSPQNLDDHVKQSVRFLKGNASERRFFDSNFVRKEYKLPTKLVLKVGFIYFLKNPFYFVAYLSIFLYVQLRIFLGFNINTKWDLSMSSKGLR